MVPVRKPGRPLSACPHPTTRGPCSCTKVTAAIPRKQKCGCGPTKTEELLQPKLEDSDVTAESTPKSPPSRASSAGNRVRKSSSKNGASGRRKSAVSAGLERTKPSMVNILPAHNGIPQNPTPPVSAETLYGNLHMSPIEPYGPMMFPTFQPQMPPPMSGPENAMVDPNGHSDSITNPFVQNQPEEADPSMKSCCGGGGKKVASAIPAQTPETATPSSKPMSELQAKSCCSSNINSPSLEPNTDAMPTPDVSNPGSVMVSPFPTPMIMPNGLYPYYAQPNVFTYPPHYGSFLQPLQPDQWRQVMASTNFAPPEPMPSPYGMPNQMPYHPPGAPRTAGGTSHQCSCGASCQCIGCAAHPYNEATQDYVRSAWQTMADDAHIIQTHGTAAHVQVNDHVNGDISLGSLTHSVPTMGTTEDTKSPTAPQTPSEAASGLSEEQALSASDFFFVSYAFGDSCAGETASCPCGDECQCLGCAIHNNPNPAIETGTET